MLKRLFFIIFYLFFFTHSVSAHEFVKISELFNVLHHNAFNVSDLKLLSLNSLKSLSLVDNSLKLYNSDTKAFLYENQQLIAAFNLPKDQENPSLWEAFTKDVLETCLSHSPKIAQNKKLVEAQIFDAMVEHIDEFSHTDSSIPSAHVLARFDENSQIIYFKPSLFFSGISHDIEKFIKQHPNNSGIILDLRGCKGGNFNEALKTADLFLDDAIIAYSSDKKQQKKFYTATPGDILQGKPIAILTDSLTASAAELIAASLSEQSRAVLVGTKTYGKNSIQNLYQFDNQIVFLTSGYFYTPSGKSLNKTGIMPQICTGIDNSCILPDKSNTDKEIIIATKLIKRNFS